MVHWAVTVPTPNPVMVVVVEFGFVMVPVPAVMDQMPVAVPTGALPVTVTTGLVEHTLWSAPALAGCAFWSKILMVTRSFVEGPHGPLLTVHWKVLAPMPNPVIEVTGEFGETMVPLPLTNVHTPVAGKITLLPAMVAVVNGVHWL